MPSPPRLAIDPAAPAIVSARRTPIGTAGHAFAALTTTDLAAPLLAEAARTVAGIGPVDDVILGNCLGPGGDVARVAALAAGLGQGVPAVTVDRQCGSGLDAVLQGAARIRAGDARLVLAGGVESASTAPWRYWPGPDGPGSRYTRAPFTPPGFPDPDMGGSADDLARKLGISRRRQDEYAARSHARAVASVAAGVFAAEILPIAGVGVDQRPRPGLTAARLARLPAAFSADGTGTAGNSCGISDGAAVLALTTLDAARALRPGERIIRVVAASVAGDDPALPGLAIETAVRRLLAHPRLAATGLRAVDIGAVEITEAFASVALAAIDGLGLDQERVCRDGGAIGLGHPWGASGAVLLVRLVARMLAPDGPDLGLAACAVGGGQGVAMVLAAT